jgi:hypothetical protein
MNTNGSFVFQENRPGFPWQQLAHTESRNNSKLWKVDRPVPLNYSIPMDWHHMMPWNAIRDAWSAVITSARWDIVENWLGLLSVDDSGTRLQEMQAGNLGGNERDELSEKLCWAKWNLVEGPNNTNRVDDPGGEGFDKFTTLKFSNSVRDRCQIVNSIYQTVRNWTVNKNDVSDSDAKALNGLFTSLRAYKGSPIAMFEPAAWVVEKDGKYDGFGNPSRHPTWKKA